MAFLDRERERAWLEDGWPPTPPRGPQLRILYGRRRVGKSALLDEFAGGKRCIVFQAVEGTIADQLRDLTAAILAFEDDPVLRAAPLTSWDAALAYLLRLAANGPLLVIFDEYQYAAESDPTLASRLQRWWSREAARHPIYLVLCGSHIRFFVKNVLTGPAYGRNTGAWQLRPLGYLEAGQFFPDWAVDDRIRAYGVTGGVPHYLQQFDASRSLAWNVAQRVLRTGSVLYQEAELLVRQELREPRLYVSILRAISDGCTRVGEITERVRPLSSSTDITPYLYTLQELGLIEYRRPVVGKTARRGVWSIVEPYLRFWFRFVVPNRAVLEHGGDPEHVYQQLVEPVLDEFVSKPTFEEICRAWVLARAASGKWNGVERVGAWWGPVARQTADNPKHRGEGELEVVASRGEHVVVAGEAKWTCAPSGRSHCPRAVAGDCCSDPWSRQRDEARAVWQGVRQAPARTCWISGRAARFLGAALREGWPGPGRLCIVPPSCAGVRAIPWKRIHARASRRCGPGHGPASGTPATGGRKMRAPGVAGR